MAGGEYATTAPGAWLRQRVWLLDLVVVVGVFTYDLPVLPGTRRALRAWSRHLVRPPEGGRRSRRRVGATQLGTGTFADTVLLRRRDVRA